MKKRSKLLASFLITIAFLVPTTFALAANTIESGIEQVDNNIILSNTNPIVMAVRIINIVLMFLGIIAVSLVIYGGFVWMTSNGNEDKIKIAKKVLKNALIGLIIILSSWGIAAFILRQLTGGGSGSGGPSNVSKGGQNYQIGLGAVGSCVVENFFPSAEKSNVPRNSSIMVTFKEEVAPESICRDNNGPCACSSTCNKINPAAIQIFKKDVGNSCGDSGCDINNTNLTNVSVGLSYDQKTIVILPKEYLGEANTSIPYSVRLTGEIKNKRNENIFGKCQPAYLEWNFSVNGLVDLVPPMVIKNGVFPQIDNERDLYTKIEGKSAIGTIQVLKPLGPAKTVSFDVEKVGDSNNIDTNSFVMSNNYQEISSSTSDVFTVTVDSGNAFVVTANGKPAGAAQPVKQNDKYFVNFPNFFSFKIGTVAAGNSWKIIVNKPYPADQIVVAGEIISFPSTLSVNAATKKIVDSLASSGIFSSASSTNSVITITAKPGAQNNLSIYSARADAVSIIPFAGGENGNETLSTRGNPDRPMNSAIQINFSKEINPLTIAGPSDYVSSTIQVVNFDSTKANDGSSCSQNDDCLSYNCGTGNKCVGNFVRGKFVLSSDYKTLEFLSDNECGVNGCGEKIYCLPAKSELKVLLMAANLEGCVSDGDCSIKNPFNKCKTLPYTLLNNEPLYACGTGSENTKFYPAADVLSLKGIIDASGNSFDGNRDTFADGPQSIFNENVTGSIGKDNFQWSFFVSDKIEASAPTITSITPNNNTSGADVNTPISIIFNRLMLNSSLITGAKTINNGKGEFIHKFINIRSFGEPAGYWISSANFSSKDNGFLDRTTIKINHSVFSSASAFNAQAGSGVRDIYQNCFRPSGSIECIASETNPSCCFGSPTSNDLGLDAAGNCQ